MLVNIQMKRKVISYAGCFTQMSVFLHFIVVEDFLLTVMAYDCYLVICHSLHYMVTMNPRLCVLLVPVSWIISALYAFLQNLLVLQLSFCAPLEIPHFFCELNQMVQLVCSDTFLNDIVMYFLSGLLGGGPFIGIIFSYSKVVSFIRVISSAQGKYKAFSTCASHLVAVPLFYCTNIAVYISSFSMHSTHARPPASVMYSVLIPMLNPFIYSLRNKDINGDLKKFLSAKP